MSKRNTDAMTQHRKEVSIKKIQAVKNALQTLIDTGAVITKSEICKMAGVSKTFIYSHPDVLEKPINDAIEAYNAKLRIMVEAPKIAADKSKDFMIESQKRRIEKLVEKIENLEETIKQKNAEIEILYGKLSEK